VGGDPGTGTPNTADSQSVSQSVIQSVSQSVSQTDRQSNDSSKRHEMNTTHRYIDETHESDARDGYEVQHALSAGARSSYHVVKFGVIIGAFTQIVDHKASGCRGT
jgi:hypothetical protein